MNETPTPRTDKKYVEGQMQDLQVGHQLSELINFSRQLERELNESQLWVKASMESAAIASATIARLETERDQLRKVADWLALIEALQPPPSRH